MRFEALRAAIAATPAESMAEHAEETDEWLDADLGSVRPATGHRRVGLARPSRRSRQSGRRPVVVISVCLSEVKQWLADFLDL